MTMSPKGFSQQLHANPKVEVCFYNGATELPEAKQMRVTGPAEFVDDVELTQRCAGTGGAGGHHRPPARTDHRGVPHRLRRGALLDADGHPQGAGAGEGPVLRPELVAIKRQEAARPPSLPAHLPTC